MFILPDGYICNINACYFSNGANNDASILNATLDKTGEGSLRSVLEPNDMMLLDRGFRDSISRLDAVGIKYAMPEFMDKTEKQLSCEKANRSRIVTMGRFVVETANGRLKNFRFLDSVIPTTYLPSLKIHTENCAAIINAFYPPLVSEDPRWEYKAALTTSRLNMSNSLQSLVLKEDWMNLRANWRNMEETQLPEFPRLTEEDLKDLTLGCY